MCDTGPDWWANWKPLKLDHTYINLSSQHLDRVGPFLKILPTEELEFCFRWNTEFIVKQSRKQKLTSGLIGRLGQIFKCLLFSPKVDFVFWEGFLLFFRKSVSCSVFTQRR